MVESESGTGIGLDGGGARKPSARPGTAGGAGGTAGATTRRGAAERPAAAEPVAQLAEQDGHDVAHVVARERVEHDDVVNAVQELRVERPLQLVLDGALDLGELRGAAFRLFEAQVASARHDLPSAEVRG